MQRQEFKYFGIRFYVMQKNDKWAYKIPYWCYEDNIESCGEAITLAENYIEENYNQIVNL